MNRNKRFSLGLSVIPLMWLFSGAAIAAEEHDHGHHDHHQVKLTLNNGAKWATDAPLREGMGGIAKAVETHMAAEGKSAAGGHAALAKEIHGQVNHIFQNCRLDKQADAVLHVILADVMKGNAIIEGKTPNAKPVDGVMTVVHALENYGKYFDHPNFKTPKLHIH